MPALSNINAAAGVACAVVSSRAALTIADSSILKKQSKFFSNAFYRDFIVCTKIRVQKIFFRSCDLGQVLECYIELPHRAKKRRIKIKCADLQDKYILASIVKYGKLNLALVAQPNGQMQILLYRIFYQNNPRQ